jgi:hypothetical protein
LQLRGGAGAVDTITDVAMRERPGKMKKKAKVEAKSRSAPTRTPKAASKSAKAKPSPKPAVKKGKAPEATVRATAAKRLRGKLEKSPALTPASLTVSTFKEAAAAAQVKPAKRRVAGHSAPKPHDLKIPKILLEGDLPPAPPVSGPGARYALAPQPVSIVRLSSSGELPEAYGTGRVFLAARDPHWLYVSWDFTAGQQRALNAASRDGHLIVRVFAQDETTPIVPEVHVHPESKNWFINVPHAETRYWAEIGFYEANGAWKTISKSQSTFTPPAAPSADVTVEFATIPAEVTFQQVVEMVQEFVTENKPLLEAVVIASEALRQDESREKKQPRERPSGFRETGVSARRRHKAIPFEVKPGTEWTAQQTESLRKLIHVDGYRRVWIGSMEITELVRRQLEEEVGSIAAAEAKRNAVAQPGLRVPALHISSPGGGEFPRAHKFWFKVNAELIIYGATEPDAKVTIGERLIKLRPDGTFSFRFALPDGRYQLPAKAVSGDGEEAREARLAFSRSTEYHGHVEPHPQDEALRSPRPEHVG